MSKYLFLEPGAVYRIYGESIGNEIAFFNAEDFNCFLDRYLNYVSPVAETLTYCFTPKHYEFLVRVCMPEAIEQFCADRIKCNNIDDYGKFVSSQIGNFLLSYTKLINLKRKRSGALFIKPFRRELISNEMELLSVMRSIHCLPVNLGLCANPEQWKFSSYASIINGNTCFVNSRHIVDQFTSMKKFIDFHSLLYEDDDLFNAA